MVKTAASSAIPVADQARAAIRERYRAAAQRLEQQGRIEEAAFVFADLLADHMTAGTLLERHGRLELAARLAEARGAAPEQVVRLWFLAGDHRRAIDVARRHRAWANAVAQLERKKDPAAVRLRMLWADHVADAGDFAGAVAIAWPIESLRRVVATWIDRGIAAGGPAGARLLIRKLVISPDELASLAPQITAVLDDLEPGSFPCRTALGEELIGSPTGPELRAVARSAARALLRDHGAGIANREPRLIRSLIHYTADATLRADMPDLAGHPGGAGAAPAAVIARRWSAGDTGVTAVYDAAQLPSGRLVVALGELGVRVLGRDGRVIAHIDQPAVRLVVSDHGTRALAIMPRGQVQRIARLDLVDRRGAYWCDAECSGGARSFDGDVWLATQGNEVLAIDTTGPRWRAIWGVALDRAVAPGTIRREPAGFAVDVLTAAGMHHWFYEGFTLRRRLQRPWDNDVITVGWYLRRDTLALSSKGLSAGDWTIPLAGASGSDVELTGERAALAQTVAAGMMITAFDLAQRRAIASFALEGAETVSLRIAERDLVIADDRGRVIVADATTGLVSRDLRIAL